MSKDEDIQVASSFDLEGVEKSNSLPHIQNSCDVDGFKSDIEDSSLDIDVKMEVNDTMIEEIEMCDIADEEVKVKKRLQTILETQPCTNAKNNVTAVAKVTCRTNTRESSMSVCKKVTSAVYGTESICLRECKTSNACTQVS